MAGETIAAAVPGCGRRRPRRGPSRETAAVAGGWGLSGSRAGAIVAAVPGCGRRRPRRGPIRETAAVAGGRGLPAAGERSLPPCPGAGGFGRVGVPAGETAAIVGGRGFSGCRGGGDRRRPAPVRGFSGRPSVVRRRAGTVRTRVVAVCSPRGGGHRPGARTRYRGSDEHPGHAAPFARGGPPNQGRRLPCRAAAQPPRPHHARPHRPHPARDPGRYPRVGRARPRAPRPFRAADGGGTGRRVGPGGVRRAARVDGGRPARSRGRARAAARPRRAARAGAGVGRGRPAAAGADGARAAGAVAAAPVADRPRAHGRGGHGGHVAGPDPGDRDGGGPALHPRPGVRGGVTDQAVHGPAPDEDAARRRPRGVA